VDLAKPTALRNKKEKFLAPNISKVINFVHDIQRLEWITEVSEEAFQAFYAYYD
jgi:hypothetical protein